MAHRGVCPDLACERIQQEIKKTGGKKKPAFRTVAKELGVPWETVRSWNRNKKKVAKLPPQQLTEFEMEERLWATMPNRFKRLASEIRSKGLFPPSEEIPRKYIKRVVEEFKDLEFLIDQLQEGL